MSKLTEKINEGDSKNFEKRGAGKCQLTNHQNMYFYLDNKDTTVPILKIKYKIGINIRRLKSDIMGAKFVYTFSEGYGKDKNLLGGKGVGLAEMAHLKIPIPPGFTITTEVCTAFYKNKGRYPQGLKRAGL